MIVRELSDGSALLILQEDHADLATQFAAHYPFDIAPLQVSNGSADGAGWGQVQPRGQGGLLPGPAPPTGLANHELKAYGAHTLHVRGKPLALREGGSPP